MKAAQPASWPGRVLGAAGLLLTVALAGRLAWELLRPMLALLIVLVVLGVVFAALFGRMRG